MEFFFKKGQCPSWYNDDYDDANDDQGQVSLQFFFVQANDVNKDAKDNLVVVVVVDQDL